MRWRAGRIATVAVAAACVLSVVSCSSNDDNGGSAADSGGTKATGESIKIGLFNPSKGAAAVAAVTTGFKAAEDYINNQIGGVNGRPIEIDDCGIDQTAPETTIACANKFVQDGVVAVIDGFNTESASALPILKSAKIPLIGEIPFNLITASSADNRVYFAPAPAAFLIGFMQQLKADGKTSLTLANADLPQARQVYEKLIVPLGAKLGITTKMYYYPPASPNFTEIATQLNDGSPAAAGLMTSPNDASCTKLAQSLRSVNYKGTVFLAACTEFIDKLGTQAVGAQTYSPFWQTPAMAATPAVTKPNLEAAQKFIDAQGGTSGFYAYGTFSILTDFARILTAAKITDYSSTNILTTLKATKNYQSFLGPVLNCGSPTSPNCTTEMLLFNVVGDKKTEPATGGFIQPLRAALQLAPGAL